MLKISRPEEHALRLVMSLARDPAQRTLGELAARERLPEPTVAKLLARLRDGGLVAAVRGRRGGYELARPAAAVSVAAVLAALRVPVLAMSACHGREGDGGPCPRLGDCGLRPVWRHLERQVAAVLERLTVSDLLQAESNMAGQVAALWPAEGALDTAPPPTAAAAAGGAPRRPHKTERRPARSAGPARARRAPSEGAEAP